MMRFDLSQLQLSQKMVGQGGRDGTPLPQSVSSVPPKNEGRGTSGTNSAAFSHCPTVSHHHPALVGRPEASVRAMSPVAPPVPPEKTKNATKTEVFTDWRIHFDQSEKWLVFPDGATRAEIEALYPAAVKAEPIHDWPAYLAAKYERRTEGGEP